MKHNDFLSWIGTAFGGILTALQTDVVFQYISLGLTILSTLVAIAFTIWKWWKKASEDGKISKEEIEELEDDLKEHIDKKEGKDE
ncbi:MAG: hypothetical protein J6S67_13300 [Methanobrevibacter sp.]|nr:hypothetical protein [Methanobrevibacter sp.]